MEEMVMPFPRPETTPPETTMYFIVEMVDVFMCKVQRRTSRGVARGGVRMEELVQGSEDFIR